jgi:transcriptional antiterminator RfaH
MPFWAVAQTESQRETTAERFLKNRGFVTYLPLIKATNARPVPLFPAYLFVELGEFGWSLVDNTIGVLGLLRSGDRPAKLPDDVIPKLRRQERNGVVHLPKKPQGPQIGDRMMILRGSFADHIGLYDGTLARERVAVLLSLLGRHVRVELDGVDLRRLS